MFGIAVAAAIAMGPCGSDAQTPGAAAKYAPDVPAKITTPDKGYNVIMRLYGPLEPWFKQTWQPGDLELQP